MMKYTLYALIGFVLFFGNFAFAQTEVATDSNQEASVGSSLGSVQVTYPSDMRSVRVQNYNLDQGNEIFPGQPNLIMNGDLQGLRNNYRFNNKNMMGINQMGGYYNDSYGCGGGEFGMMRGVGMMFAIILILAILFFVFKKYMHHKKHHHCKCVCNCGCGCECCCDCKCMDSMNTIRERYARGEIDRYEFEEKKKMLE